jgi:hypothetical protein
MPASPPHCKSFSRARPLALCLVASAACSGSGSASGSGSGSGGGTDDHGVAVTSDSVLHQQLTAALSDWQELPVLHHVHYGAVTSTDPDLISFDGYDFGDKDFSNVLAACNRPALRDQIELRPSLCQEGLDGYVLAAVDDGPGVISRLWFTNMPLDGERLRIYLDDLSAPALDVSLDDWRSGQSAPFQAPLTSWTSGALVSNVPIAYRSRFRVVLDQVDPSGYVFYQVDYNRGPGLTDHLDHDDDASGVASAATIVDALVHLETDGAASRTQRSQALLAPASQHRVFAADGGGTIERLHFTIEPATQRALADTQLRVHWDGMDAPAIDLSLDALFGCRQELASFDTAAMTVSVGANAIDLTLRLPMPYANGAAIELFNQGQQSVIVNSEIEVSDEISVSATGRLHAMFNLLRAPFEPGSRYPVVDLRGRGKYLGTLFYPAGIADVDGGWPNPLSFLEGDERIFADGAEVDHGTGTEDYFNAGWYFQDGPYSSAFSAMIALESDPAAGTGRVSALRWHLLNDAIEFERSFRLEFEYGNDAPSTVTEYASVGFYYLF